MTSRNIAFLLVAGAALLAGCDSTDPFRAQLPTEEDVYDVYALNGTPATMPSGIHTYARVATKVDGNATFDVALDIDASGRVVVYPVQRVVSAVSTLRRVGLRKVDGSFASVTLAPSGSYPDSAVTVAAGEVVVVQTARSGFNDVCQFALSPYIYAKIVVEEIFPGPRNMTVRAVVDPNCGFRSFEQGIPNR